MKKGVENGTTRLAIDTTRLTNPVHEATIHRTGIRGQATGLAIGDAKSCSGMGVAYRCLGSGFVGFRQKDSDRVAWNHPRKTFPAVILGEPVHF